MATQGLSSQNHWFKIHLKGQGAKVKANKLGIGHKIFVMNLVWGVKMQLGWQKRFNHSMQYSFYVRFRGVPSDIACERMSPVLDQEISQEVIRINNQVFSIIQVKKRIRFLDVLDHEEYQGQKTWLHGKHITSDILKPQIDENTRVHTKGSPGISIRHNWEYQC